MYISPSLFLVGDVLMTNRYQIHYLEYLLMDVQMCCQFGIILVFLFILMKCLDHLKHGLLFPSTNVME